MLNDLAGTLGRPVRTAAAGALRSVLAAGAFVRAGASLPAAARRASALAVRRQVIDAGWDALPIVTAVAILCGAVIIAEANAQAARFGLADSLGRIVVAAGVRDVGPTLTGLIVAGFSGTAIAAELATAQALGEADALDALGVNLLQYYVLPRVVGVALATAALTLFFAAVTLAAGLVTVDVLRQMDATTYLAAVRSALHPADVWETIARGLAAGAGIAAVSSAAGLAAQRTPSAVPRSARHAMIWSTAAVFLVTATGAFIRFGL